MKLSEDFFSIQAEGSTFGTPAYFIRFCNCNLCCEYCDTQQVMKRSYNLSEDDLLNKIKKEKQLDNVLDGVTHLVWTGGEPFLKHNAIEIIGFLRMMERKFGETNTYNEIETNGTITNYDLAKRMQQINCSPKLSNSGMSKRRRVNKKGVEMVCNHHNGLFKFVVGDEKDVVEAERDFIHPYQIPQTKVYLMPQCVNREELGEKTREIFELAKKYGYRATTRGQILVWGRKNGV